MSAEVTKSERQLLAESMRLKREVERLTAERDKWLAKYEGADDGWGVANERADKAEAELRALRDRMESLADEFDAKGRRGSAHFGADVGDTIRLWIERDPRVLPPEVGETP